MKKNLFLLPILILSFNACTEEVIIQKPVGSKTITAVIVKTEISSRTCMDESENGTIGGVLWSPHDIIGVYSASGTENASFTSSNTVSTGEAEFTGNLSDEPAYAYYPYNSNNTGKSLLTGELPLTQEYSSADGKLTYDYKIGKPQTGNNNKFSFTHLFALLRFTVDASGTALEGDKLEQITLSFPEDTKIQSGTFNVPVSGGDITWSQESSGNELIMKWSDTPDLSDGTTYYGYFACPAIGGLTNKDVTVSLQTTQYCVSFSATLEIDAFVPNAIYTFPLTLSKWAEKLGDAFKVSERPVLNGIKFTAADNEGKILGKKLYYTSKSSSSWWGTTSYYTTYTTDESQTTQTMTIGEKEITGCIPYLNDRNLIPTLSYTEGASVHYSTDNGESYIKWDGTSTIDFSIGNILRISKDGANRDYVINITNTGLPVVIINQPNGDTSWEQTGENVFSKATKFDTIEDNYPGNITVYNADGSVDLATATSMTRLRGNTTQAFPKKPFAVKLGSKSQILGMKKHKRWVLLANWKDKSLMRNHIALGIAQKFTNTFTDGIPWNVSGQFVELIYNGVHVGNYYLCEQIKIDENRLNIQPEYDSEDYPSITSDQVGQFGYLLECDDYYDENTKFLTKHYIPFQFKDDGDAAGVILNYVKAKVQGIEDNLYQGFKNKDASAYKAAYTELDLPSVVDQLLIYEMTMNSEMGHPRSVYMYINGTGKLCAGPVWDFDWLSFPIDNDVLDELNNGWDRSYNASLMSTASHINKHYVSSTTPSSSRTDDVPYIWYPMMITESTFQDLAAERWQTIAPILEAYAENIKQVGQEIALSWEYNNAMWPAYYNDDCDRQKYCDGGYCGDERMTSFNEIYNAMYNAYLSRLNGMDFVVNKNWPTWTID